MCCGRERSSINCASLRCLISSACRLNQQELKKWQEIPLTVWPVPPTSPWTVYPSWWKVPLNISHPPLADYIYPRSPVTSLNYVCSPVHGVIDFEISGISSASSATTTAIAEAIDSVFFENGNPLGTGKIYLSDINRAIGDVAGTGGFILVSPTTNIEPGVGLLPVRGEVNYT